MTLSIKEYDKVVRKFVDDYVNNLNQSIKRFYCMDGAITY